MENVNIPGPGVDFAAEVRFLHDVLVPLTGWEPGDQIYHIGAGIGFHADVLRRMGYRCAAVEPSLEVCELAVRYHPYLTMINADPGAWSPPLYKGHVFARGMPWWHYELAGINRHGMDVEALTQHIFDNWMEQGHTLTLQILTDGSGRLGVGGVVMNMLDDYYEFFNKYGKTKVYDWTGVMAEVTRHLYRGVIVVVEKGTKTWRSRIQSR